MTSSWISATQVVDHDFDCWGSITCMDAHHPWVYVGTSRGVVVAYFIESGEPSSDAQGLWQEQPNFCPIGESSRSDPGSRVMHTAQLSGNEETPVLWMKLHASGKLLFVRDGLRRLLVWNIESHVWVVQASVASFFVDLCDVHTTHLHRHQGWLQRQGPTFTVEVDACCLCTVENVRAARDAQRVEGIPSKVGQHCILRVVDFCCGQQRLRELQVMALRDAGHAETIAFSGLHVIIASAWSYRAISLLDGSVKVLMRLDSEPPLMAVGGRGEVFFRRGLAIYATEVHSSSDTIEVGAPLQVDEPPRMMMARFPFVCAFSNDGCCCYSLLAQEDDEGVVERLPLLDCIFGMAQPRSNILYAATTKSVTMIVIPQLRHQLRALVEGDRVEEAFHLLSVRRQGSSEDFSELERQLHLLCGFAHLSHQRPRDAMQHFGDWLDPRDLIKLLPHCISDLTVPPSSSLLQLVRRPRCGYTTRVGTVDVKATASRESTLASSRSSSSDAGFWHDSRSSAAGEMWGIISSSHLVEAWGRCFQQLPVATSAQDGGAKENMEPCREVPHVGPLNLSSYLERCWVELKNEVLHYFRARLDVLTLPIAYARCMEYALLHLHLERGDHRSAYHLISHCRELCVSDVYDLLSSIDEHRLLALLLFRHGYGEEAREVMDVHLSLSQRLGLSKHPRRSNEESEPHRSRDDDMEKDPVILERHRLWSRQTHSDTSHWLHVKGNTPPTGITGHALWRLSPRLRARVARCLKTADDPVEAPSSQELANMYNKATDEDLHDAAMHVMSYKPLGGSRNEPTTFFTFLGASACELASEATPLPSLLSELSYLILDHMNLPAAAQLLEERPQEVFFRDEEGATVLHHLASVVARLPKHQSSESTSTAMHQLLLAVLQRLIHAGAPLHHITVHGLSVFDAGSVVTGEEGLHWWVSAVLTCADLQSCSTLLAPSR